MSVATDDNAQYLFEHVTTRARSGFYTEEQVLEDIEERVSEELGHPDAELVAKLRAHARTVLAERAAAEATWPARTENDAIAAAFRELMEKRGIVALENAGYTMSDGWSDVNQIATDLTELGRKPRGATFYHGQDLERAVAGKGLLLAFGAYEDDEARADAQSLVIARDIVDTLKRHGVDASWDGTLDQRIRIAPFEWRKRARKI